MLLLAVLLLLAFCCWWRYCCCWRPCWSLCPGYFSCLLYILDCTMRHSKLSEYRTMAIGLLFFQLSDYWNIEYRIGDFKKLSDYRVSDQGLNLSDYRISDSDPPLRIRNLTCAPWSGCRQHYESALLSASRRHICNKNYDRIKVCHGEKFANLKHSYVFLLICNKTCRV